MHSSDKEIESLFDSEGESLFRIAYYKIGSSSDAADIVQDTFMKVWDARARLHIRDMKRYLYRSVANACISYLRERGKVTFTSLQEAAAVQQDELPDTRDEMHRIAALMARLPHEQAEVIALRTIGGKSFAEIADITNQPPATVKSRFRYGIEKLRVLLLNPSKKQE